MTARLAGGPPTLEERTRALLDLVEADCARQCAQILGDANERAAARRAQARAEALARVREAFDEQRRLRDAQIAAAQARLATQRRLHAQQRSAALLQLAWQQLPGELQARWQQADTRTAWVAHVLASARRRLPRGAWRILHAADWPDAETAALAAALASENSAPALFEIDDRIAAGLKIAIDGNVIDGTRDGLLADRAALDAQLLRRLEAVP